MATNSSLDEETSKKVIRQVEFYFSDSNLPRDKFLRNTINDSQDGMISLALICSFAKMRSHLSLGDVKADGVSEDTVKAVAETLRTSDFLIISEDGKKVGRRTQLNNPDEVIEQVDSRTVAASPLPYDTKLEDVESFFSQFGKVNSVRLPRVVSHKQIYCGTALVEFSAEEDADKVLKQTVEYAGLTLELKPKKDFDVEREKEEEEYRKSGGHVDEDSEETSYTKGLIVAFTLKKKPLGDESKQNGSDEQVGEAEGPKVNGSESLAKESEEAVKTSENDKSGDAEKAEEPIEEAAPDEEEKVSEGDEKSSETADKNGGEKTAPEGKTVIDAYKDNMDVIMREDLKAVFQKFGNLKYVDFQIGETSGYLRFEEPHEAQKARAAAVLCEEGGLAVKNYIAILEPVSGDAEKQYWSQVQGNQGKFRDNRGRGRGRGGKFNNRGGRHGRHRDRDSSAGRPNKFQKAAA